MSEIDLVLRFDGFQSSELTSLHFGTNMLFHTDRVTPNSDFSQLIENLGIELIRFPGGTIAEQFFDLQNPNNTSTPNLLDILNGSARIETRSVVPLSEYLNYMERTDGVPTIVLPTFRYFDQDTRQLSAAGAIQIRDFVINLINGEFGYFDQGIFEIGNEWYQTNFNWSAEEFGRFQSEMATLIVTILNDLGARSNVDILAQTGQTDEEHEVLASFFNDPFDDNIDGVLTHL
jgi:hypothetical protein